MEDVLSELDGLQMRLDSMAAQPLGNLSSLTMAHDALERYCGRSAAIHGQLE